MAATRARSFVVILVCTLTRVLGQPSVVSLSWVCRPGVEYEDFEVHCPKSKPAMSLGVSIVLNGGLVEAFFVYHNPLSARVTGACIFTSLENAEPLFVGQDLLEPQHVAHNSVPLARADGSGESSVAVQVVVFRELQVMDCFEAHITNVGDRQFRAIPTGRMPHSDLSSLRELIADAQLSRSVFRFAEFSPPSLERSYLDVLMGALLDNFNFAQGQIDPNGVIDSSVQGLVGQGTVAFGSFWPAWAKTMVGIARMRHTEYCVRSVIADHLPGDFMETGVWRGGVCIYVRGIFHALGVRDRTVWVADSFQGLPEPDAAQFPEDQGCDHHTMNPALAVSLEEVQTSFMNFNLGDDKVKFIAGFFESSMPKARADGLIKQLAVLRLDGDMYSSTYTVLENMYDLVVDGGYIIIDDYFSHRQARTAVHDFWNVRNITGRIWAADKYATFWRKNTPCYRPPRFTHGHWAFFPSFSASTLAKVERLVGTPMYERFANGSTYEASRELWLL